MGNDRQTAVVLQSTGLLQQHPEFTLMHEMLLYAGAAQIDDNIFADCGGSLAGFIGGAVGTVVMRPRAPKSADDVAKCSRRQHRQVDRYLATRTRPPYDSKGASGQCHTPTIFAQKA